MIAYKNSVRDLLNCVFSVTNPIEGVNLIDINSQSLYFEYSGYDERMIVK